MLFNFRTLQIIELLENKLQKPVLTSNMCSLWRMLRLIGNRRVLPHADACSLALNCPRTSNSSQKGSSSMRNKKWLWLLLVPFAALAFPAVYSRTTPDLFGFPFFYWYQFAWVPLTAAITAIVYWKTR